MVNKDFEYRIDRIDYIGGKKSFDFLSEEFARLAANATTLTRFTASPAFLIMKGAKAEIFQSFSKILEKTLDKRQKTCYNKPNRDKRGTQNDQYQNTPQINQQ